MGLPGGKGREVGSPSGSAGCLHALVKAEAGGLPPTAPTHPRHLDPGLCWHIRLPALPCLPVVTKEVLPGFAALLAQYTQRSPAGAPAQLQDEEAAAWAAALRQEALGAAAALRRAVEACRAAAAEAEAAGSGDDDGPSHGNAHSQGGAEQHGQRQQDVGSSEGEGAGAVAAAAEQLARAVSQLGAALRHAPLDAATAHALQQCAAQLGQLLGAG